MQENELPSLPAEANQHFVEALVDLSQHHEIEVSEDIYAQNGTKLLARGARVDSRLYERVINHRLRRPIETSLVSSHAVGVEDLCHEAERLLEEIPLLKGFCSWSMGAVTPLSILARLKFSPQAGTLLSVAESRNPKTRAHITLVTLLAMGLAYAAKYRDSERMAEVAGAGVFHDVGEIYVDPGFFASPAEITPLCWRSYASHPIIGAALAREVVGLDSVSQAAILQHHERGNGVGYPRGVAGNTLSPVASMLGLAEVVAAMRGRDCPLHRINIALKIVPHEFDPAFVHLAMAFLEEQNGKCKETPESSDRATAGLRKICERITRALELRDEWQTKQPFSIRARELVEATYERFLRIQRAFLSTGVDGLDALMPVLADVELREIDIESSCVQDEIFWRLKNLSRDLALKSLDFPEDERREILRLVNILAGWTESPAVCAESGGESAQPCPEARSSSPFAVA